MKCLAICFFLLFYTPRSMGFDWNQEFQEFCIADHKDNTPCATKCKIGENCSVLLSDFDNPLSMHEKQYLLDVHNLMRERIARGDYVRWHFPPATNMHVLNYDDDCEFMTTCWIRQCNFWHDVHFMVNGSRYGQNLHKRGTSGTFGKVDDSFLLKGLTNWFAEYKLLEDDPQLVHSWYKVSGTGHFTALVWAKTSLVGCAKTLFRGPGGQENFFLFCNYFPNGNTNGAQVYNTEPYECERNDRYPHLCGHITNLIEEGVYHETGAGHPLTTPSHWLTIAAAIFIYCVVFITEMHVH